MKRIISAVVALIGLAVPACTDFDEGWAAYVRGDYATAVREWRLLAEQGDGTAQLKSVKAPSTAAAFRGGRGVRAGEDVVVTGFPLHGLLSSDLNVTNGIVSALAGPGNNRRLIQITAPVQRGNRGGPVLDQSGHVVGVVVARLDALKLVQRTGKLPQNVNFAISEGTARAFLDANNVPYEVEPSDKPLPSADIAAKARHFTVRVECWK